MKEDKKELFDRDDVFPSDVEVTGFAWRAIWDEGEGHSAYNLANNGYKVCFNAVLQNMADKLIILSHTGLLCRWF